MSDSVFRIGNPRSRAAQPGFLIPKVVPLGIGTGPSLPPPLQADTVSVVLNDYLSEFKEKLSSKLDNLQHLETSADASKKDIADALKEIARIKKALTDLNDRERFS